MPNWCNNNITISHPDRSKMEALVEAIKDGKFLNHIIPVPKDLTDTVAGSMGEEHREAHEAQQKTNVDKYGYANWYDFCVSRWGTKWDVDAYDPDSVVLDDNNTVSFGFDSAWSPPTGIYEAMVEEGYSVEAYYYESGMGYCGVWQDGVDDCYEIGGMSSKEVRETIPESLDDMMCISECMAEYEDSEKDEVELWYEEGVEKQGLTPHKANE